MHSISLSFTSYCPVSLRTLCEEVIAVLSSFRGPSFFIRLSRCSSSLLFRIIPFSIRGQVSFSRLVVALSVSVRNVGRSAAGLSRGLNTRTKADHGKGSSKEARQLQGIIWHKQNGHWTDNPCGGVRLPRFDGSCE